MAVFCDVVLVFWPSIRRLRTRWCSKILIQVASYLYVNYTNRNANIAIIDHRLDALLFANHSDGCSSSFLGMHAIVFVCLLVCLLFVRTRLVLFALYMLLIEGFLLQFIFSFHIHVFTSSIHSLQYVYQLTHQENYYCIYD